MAKEKQDQQILESKRDECNSSVLKKLFEDLCSCFLLAHADDVITTIDKESDLIAAVDYSDEEEGVCNSAAPPSFGDQCISIPPSSVTSRARKTTNSNVIAPISRASVFGGNIFIVRSKSNSKVPLECDEEIFEEDAVCEICFKAFKVNEDIVKLKCKCKNELVHEACVTKSNCGVCEQQVEKIHLILLQLPTDDAGVTTHNNGKKKLKWFSLFKW